jgi:hypothetical protein
MLGERFYKQYAFAISLGALDDVEGGVHLGPSNTHIPRSDSPCFEPATFYVLGVRFTDASEKN